MSYFSGGASTYIRLLALHGTPRRSLSTTPMGMGWGDAARKKAR